MFTRKLIRWINALKDTTFLWILTGLWLVFLPNSLLLPIGFLLLDLVCTLAYWSFFLVWTPLAAVFRYTREKQRSRKYQRSYNRHLASLPKPPPPLTRGGKMQRADDRLLEARLLAESLSDPELKESFLAEAEIVYREELARLLNE